MPVRTVYCERTVPDNATLVLVITLHIEVAVVCDGKDVRRHLSYLLIGVETDLVCCVDGQQLVRVHCHQDGPCVCLPSGQIRGIRQLLYERDRKLLRGAVEL